MLCCQYLSDITFDYLHLFIATELHNSNNKYNSDYIDNSENYKSWTIFQKNWITFRLEVEM